MPHRLLRTEFVEDLEDERPLHRLRRSAFHALELRRAQRTPWREFLADGLRLSRSGDRTVAQTAMAANTPMLLKAGLVDGDLSAGMLASGQVVGALDDLPTCAELVERVVAGAVERLAELARLTTSDPQTTARLAEDDSRG